MKHLPPLKVRHFLPLRFSFIIDVCKKILFQVASSPFFMYSLTYKTGFPCTWKEPSSTSESNSAFDFDFGEVL